ncbi:DR2241 family protein [Halomarina salina]|uniref:DR2241 family protein n=1 Tax=Halomarina salina TaxID=1872699 RepID=A0ABD5RHH8_9EURY|nr:DR2241 family protein [Halomarina salina]
MDDSLFESLRDAADEGVELDGFTARRTADGYVVETPEERREGLPEDEFRQVAGAHADYVTNWDAWRDLPDARRAFLRWVEGADERSVEDRYAALRDGGIQRHWGELLLTATLDETDGGGGRHYYLRHEDDADESTDDLDVHEDPLDARDIAKLDDDGRYRPLKTAPTLRTGWVFPRLTGERLVQAVDFFYPATVANWHREREGDLDVTHWRETAERQTGIYEIIDELSGEQVEWLAESCCVDSQCLKRRQWDEDEETDLDVPRGDGEFPCREPCSLVVAAARKWAINEGETEREYTFTLTPSEKGQLEDLVDAVAEGRTDEIREADVFDGANRYRARWLRAKRFDEAGELPAVERDRDQE